jgi:hypothetical protein
MDHERVHFGFTIQARFKATKSTPSIISMENVVTAGETSENNVLVAYADTLNCH